VSDVLGPIDCEDAVPLRREEPRAAYIPPKLTSLGDVRGLTLGGTPGTGDSINPSIQKPPA